MNETIDKTQWVPKGETVINVWRLQHGDVCHNEGRYYLMYPLMVDWLRGKELLTDDHLHCAFKIRSLHKAAFAQAGIAQMRDQKTESGNGWWNEYGIDALFAYKAIMEPLLRWQQHMIARVAWEEMKESDKAVFEQKLRHSITTAFDSLQKSLEHFEKMMQNAKDGGSTGAPEIHTTR